MANLEELTMTRLKALAKEHNIKNISKLKKDELIAVLSQVIGEEDDKPETSLLEEEGKKDKILEENNFIEEKDIPERQYDENGEPIIDYKLTNEGDQIVEGILDIEIYYDPYTTVLDSNINESKVYNIVTKKEV